MSGYFLPPQIIYQGKSKKCLPTVSFPKSWHVSFMPNHWATEKTTEDYINKILIPYIESKRKEQSSSALVIFDRFKGQCTQRILSLLSSNNIHIAVVPGNCTTAIRCQRKQGCQRFFTRKISTVVFRPDLLFVRFWW